MVNCVHVIDPDVQRRARISHELHTHPLHVEIYENLEEFVDVAPDDGLILLADDSDGGGEHVSQVIGQSQVALPVVAYAEDPSSSDVVEAMLAGALGYLRWPFDERELYSTLKRVSVEGVRTLRRRRIISEARFRIDSLSRREKQVLTGLIRGLSNKDIGQALDISPRTVEIHRSNMMSKLRAQSVADAVRQGLYAGLDEVADAA